MYLTAHRKGPKDLTSPFDRSHAGILSWKMTNFTPIFWLPMEIRHTRWILNPYKVYIFWKLHVLGTYWVKSQICSTNIEGVGFFSEHEKWNVTKILKCVLKNFGHLYFGRLIFGRIFFVIYLNLQIQSWLLIMLETKYFDVQEADLWYPLSHNMGEASVKSLWNFRQTPVRKLNPPKFLGMNVINMVIA